MSDNENRNQNSQPQGPHGFQVTIDYMLERKIDSLLWMTRLGTLVFTILSMIPLFGVNPITSYHRALMCNAATSALRLHQRIGPVHFSREFFAMLMMEDSCHYLLYSILFIFSYPITLSLLPIFLFAILHSINYSVIILNKLGHYETWLITSLHSIACKTGNILRLAAFTEVCLLPLTVLWAFSGKGNLFTPFAYYRFLTFRYASRRNPYTRSVFHEMRIILEMFANTPGRNLTLQRMSHKVIDFTSRLAPQIPNQQ